MWPVPEERLINVAKINSNTIPPIPMKYSPQRALPPIQNYIADLMDEVGVTTDQLVELRLDYGPHHPLAARVMIEIAYSTWGFEVRGYDKNGLPEYGLYYESHRSA